MKKQHSIKRLALICTIIFTCNFWSNSQNIGINSDSSTPDPSAILDVKSNSKGLLLPRMTTVERDAIINPVMSLLIFNTDTKCYEGYNSDDNTWYAFGCLDGNSTWPEENVFCTPTPTEIMEVVNPQTGRTWMDRNLGALQVATSSTDEDSYGDLYQWGRLADGHQCRDSDITTTLSSSDQPNHSDFITPIGALGDSFDWRSPKNDNLWQGVNGVNNPCPLSYRLPTETEISEEILTWSSDNSNGAFNSPLKFPLSGYRNRMNGQLETVNAAGTYWTSSVVGTNAKSILYSSSGVDMYNRERSFGFSVRCIKNE